MPGRDRMEEVHELLIDGTAHHRSVAFRYRKGVHRSHTGEPRCPFEAWLH